MESITENMAYVADQSTLTLGIAAAATTTALVAAVRYMNRPAIILPPFNVNSQSVEIEPGVRANPLTKEKIIEFLYDDAKTMYEAFQRGIKVSKNGPCLGTRDQNGGPYKWITYQEVYDTAHALGSAFIEKGLKPGKESFVGIFAGNRNEWVMTAEACNIFSMVTVPLYDTYGKEACIYIVNNTEITLAVCDSVDKANLLIDNAKDMPSLKTVVVVGPVTNNNQENAEKHGVDVISFNELVEFGKKHLKIPVPPKPEDLATICYTSGTTGNPKGVMLSHKNIISDVSGTFYLYKDFFECTPDDVHISYLPLAHMFERVAHAFYFMSGTRIGFFRGDVRKLTDDILELKPTIFLTVPRLLNRMYDTVMAKVHGSWFSKNLLSLALARKQGEVERGLIRNNSILDYIVFSKIQKQLGGKLRICITGSAPLSGKVLNFCRCAFGCPVLEGYGQTECTAAVTAQIPGEPGVGHVGCPLPCNWIKLVDVPDMGYYAKDNKGEICIKGSNTFMGYFKEPEKTADTIDKDGWVHSGDVGTWQENGTLRIFDRAKHIFKLAQGEYIAPEKIENVYVRSPYVAQVFVEGNSLRPCTVGIVVPNYSMVKKYSNETGCTDDMVEICKHKGFKDTVLKDIINLGKKSGLKSFEQVKDIHLCPEAFSVENGLLTPTLKSKRPALRKHYAEKVEELYSAM